MSMLPKEHIRALDTEYKLIKLLFHRNKNQHRATVWWRHLNTLKRTLTKLIALLKKAKLTSHDEGRILDLALYLRCVVTKQCFRAFNEIIALGQFISLGLTLLGMLAKVDSEVGFIEGLDGKIRERKMKGMNSSVNKESKSLESNIGELGEEIGEDVGESILEIKKELKKDSVTTKEVNKKRRIVTEMDSSIEKKKVKKVKKTSNSLESFENSSDKVSKDKKKKKKKKSAIDDIFGF